MQVRYQKLLPEHAKRYRDIRLESLRLHPEQFASSYEEQKDLPELRLERSIRKQEANTLVMGAFTGKALIGICACVGVNSFGLQHTGTLIQVYVRSDYSGQKIGLGLVSRSVKNALELSHIQQVVLEVKRTNFKAIKVYTQAGFQTFIPKVQPDDESLYMKVDHSYEGL